MKKFKQQLKIMKIKNVNLQTIIIGVVLLIGFPAWMVYCFQFSILLYIYAIIGYLAIAISLIVYGLER